MASTDSIPVPRKNTAFRLYFTVRDASGVPVTGFTSPDSEVSKDGGAFADCTNEATYVGHGRGYIDLTSTEMNADSVGYYMSCTEGNIDVDIAPEELGDIRADAAQLGGSTQSATDLKDFADTGYDPATHKVAGLVLADTTTTLTNAPSDSSGVTTLLSRLSSARAGYLDNLNVGGAVASQADVNNLNQSASRRVLLTALGQMERPESGSTTFQIEARTYTADGALVNADSTPTLTATGTTTGSLAANLSVASNPSTGVYRWTYTVSSGDTLEQVRLDLSAVISSDTETMCLMTQVADFVAATFTTADRTKIDAIHGKLPSVSYLAGAAASDGKVAVVNGTGTGEVPTAAQNAAAAAAQVTTDHGSGSYLRNTEPLTAATTRDALGLAAGDLDTQLGALAEQADLEDAIETIDQIEEDTRLMRAVIAGVRSAADSKLTCNDRDGTTPYVELTQGTTPGQITDVGVLI